MITASSSSITILLTSRRFSPFSSIFRYYINPHKPYLIHQPLILLKLEDLLEALPGQQRLEGLDHRQLLVENVEPVDGLEDVLELGLEGEIGELFQVLLHEFFVGEVLFEALDHRLVFLLG